MKQGTLVASSVHHHEMTTSACGAAKKLGVHNKGLGQAATKDDVPQ